MVAGKVGPRLGGGLSILRKVTVTLALVTDPTIQNSLPTLVLGAEVYHEIPASASNAGNGLSESRPMTKQSRQTSNALKLAQQLHKGGRLAEAERLYRQIIAASPRHADAYQALSMLALQAGQPTAAEALIRKAIELRPSADFLLARANVLLALGRSAEAVLAAQAALKLKPSYARAFQILGHALYDNNDALAAIDAYRQALKLDHNLADLRSDLGIALRLAGRLEEAEHVLHSAPPNSIALVNLSNVQKERGKFHDAETTLRRALTIAPQDPILLYNFSLLMNLLGRQAEAWPAWENRFRAGAVTPRHFAKPQWMGEELAGRTLLVHSEQGLGDIIQFARYVLPIQGRVLFEVPSSLVRLFSSNPDMPKLVPADTPLPTFDTVVPLLSLPVRMCMQPRKPPYLFAESQCMETWSQRVGKRGYRVGIAWQGFSGRHEDVGRSLPLASFAPLVAIPGVRLISLQRGEGVDQIEQVNFPVERFDDLDSGGDAFIDTAAVMKLIDLVITSDTSVAHLAGALGCPVWVALRKVPDWRWMLDREDSPWYPSMRLFRQKIDGDWASVFQEMAGKVATEKLP